MGDIVARPRMRLSYDTNRGAKCARDTRKALGLAPGEPLPCLLDVVEKLVGVPVAVIELGEVAGAYLHSRGRAFIFINDGDPIVRKRFSLAHELGHHRLGHAPVIETWPAIYAKDNPPSEVQANAFAAEFVAPKEGVVAWLDENQDGPLTLEAVCRLSARYGLSVQATRYRLATVGVLSDVPLAQRLDAEIAAGDHKALLDYLDLPYPDDELARTHGHGPRLPKGSDAGLLGALLRGDVDVTEAAAAIGQEPAHLERVVEDAGIPC